jgi:carboxyl-terminal processing protease
MARRFLGISWPLAVWTMIVAAFAAGVLIERYQFLLVADHEPPGVEKTFRPFWETWNHVEKSYVDRSAVQPERMTHGAINGMLASLGDAGHTAYLSKDQFENMEAELAPNFEGIGARMGVINRKPTITSTMPGSPARAAGLKKGDVLLQVGGETIANLPLDQIVRKVRGAPGTQVTLVVSRAGQSKPLEFSIARAKLDVAHVTWRMLPGMPIAHVAIESFGHEAAKQLKEALSGAQAQNARALVLDVRFDSGGLKEEAVSVTSQFLKDGNVFIERDAHDNRKAIPVSAGGAALEIPLCVLVNGGTASSAEIFAGALQDHARGKLIGTRTFGAGTVLQPFHLSDGSALLLAVYEWLTPNGRSIWKQGIIPDIVLPLPDGAAIDLPEDATEQTAVELAKTGDKQLLKAIEVLKGVINPSSANGA